MLTLFVEATSGDCGDDITKVIITSNDKLTEALPPLENISLEARFIATESWAYICWEKDYDGGDWGKEDEDKNDAKADECIGIAFISDFEGTSFKRASYESLRNNLLELVKENIYEERRIYNGNVYKVTYVYELDNKLFK